MPALDHYSHSSLTAWDNCPARAAWHYVDGHEEPQSEDAKRGQLVHEAVEVLSRHCVTNRMDSDSRFANRLADACPDPHAARIIRQAGDFLVFDAAMVLQDERGVEHKWEVLSELGDKVVGRVDRLEWNEAEGELIVTDYKSGSRWPQASDPAPLQLRLYGWAMLKEWPQTEILALRMIYLSSRTVGQWQFLPDDPLVGQSWVQDWISRVKAMMPPYPECPGSWCGYCGRVEDCAQGRLAREHSVCDEASAIDAAADALVYEAAAARRRKQVDKYRREVGIDVQVGDVRRTDVLPQWFLRHKPRLLPREGKDVAVRDLLEEMGKSVLDLVDWNPEALGALMESQGAEEGAPGEVFLSPEELKEMGKLGKLLEPVVPKPRAAWEKVKDSEEDGNEIAGGDGDE